MGPKEFEIRSRMKWVHLISFCDLIHWYTLLEAYIEDESEHLEGKRSMLYNFDNESRIYCYNKEEVYLDESELLIELRREWLIEEEYKQIRKWLWEDEEVNDSLQYEHE